MSTGFSGYRQGVTAPASRPTYTLTAFLAGTLTPKLMQRVQVL